MLQGYVGFPLDKSKIGFIVVFFCVVSLAFLFEFGAVEFQCCAKFVCRPTIMGI